jgi:hypothetical protein
MFRSLLLGLVRGLGPDAALEIAVFFARSEHFAKPCARKQLTDAQHSPPACLDVHQPAPQLDLPVAAPFLHATRACARRRDGREPRQNERLRSTTRPAIAAPELRDDLLRVGGGR